MPPAPAASRLGRPPAMTAGQIRHARDLLTRPDNTVSSIARLLGVSRATIYKYVPELPGRPRPAAAVPSGRNDGREQRLTRRDGVGSPDHGTLRCLPVCSAQAETPNRPLTEYLGANIEDLGTDRDHRVLRVHRKGGKIQALTLPAPAAARIDAYLASLDDVTALPAVPCGTADSARRRVLSATGTRARMYRVEVRALLRRLGRAAGLPEDLAGSLSPHSMRHAFAALNQV